MPTGESIKVVSAANLEYYKTLSDQVYQTEAQVDAAIDEANTDQMNYKGEVDNISSATSIETYPENSVVKDANNVFYIQTGSTSVSWVEMSAADTEVAWDDITGKPASFTPSTHTHSATDITSGRLATARGGVPSPSSSGLVLTSTGSGAYGWSASSGGSGSGTGFIEAEMFNYNVNDEWIELYVPFDDWDNTESNDNKMNGRRLTFKSTSTQTITNIRLYYKTGTGMSSATYVDLLASVPDGVNWNGTTLDTIQLTANRVYTVYIQMQYVSGSGTLRAYGLVEDKFASKRLLPEDTPTKWELPITDNLASTKWHSLAVPLAVKEYALAAGTNIAFEGTDQPFNFQTINYSFGPLAYSIYHSSNSLYYRVPAQQGYRISASCRATNVTGNATNAALSIRVGTSTLYANAEVVAECISGLWAGSTGNITQLVIPPVYVPPATTGTYRYIFLCGRCTNGGEQIQQSTPPTASKLVIELLPDLD